MAEWRWGEGWTEAELAARLERARALPPNFRGADAELTLETGWSQVRSQAVVGREPPGPPVPGGAFERARALLTAFEFSDPRIVVGHYGRGEPLEGRTALLELRVGAVGLRYLCPVRVTAVSEALTHEETLFAHSVETLEGHLEAGREWFLLTKDHETGAVRFRIEARWREGRFPNWWSRLGFALVGRRYQRAWHRLTHVRLRALLREHAVVGPARGDGALRHPGHAVETGPIQLFAQRAHGARRTRVEEEEEVEAMHTDRMNGWTPLGLGVLAGMRSMSAPALVSRRLSHARRPARGWLGQALASRASARALAVLQVCEMIADKLPIVPARTAPLPLVGRVLGGALAGAAAGAGTRRTRLQGALLGVLGALASTFAFYQLRRVASHQLGLPIAVAGLAEDALVLTLGARLLPERSAHAW